MFGRYIFCDSVSAFKVGICNNDSIEIKCLAFLGSIDDFFFFFNCDMSILWSVHNIVFMWKLLVLYVVNLIILYITSMSKIPITICYDGS